MGIDYTKKSPSLLFWFSFLAMNLLQSRSGQWCRRWSPPSTSPPSFARATLSVLQCRAFVAWTWDSSLEWRCVWKILMIMLSSSERKLFLVWAHLSLLLLLQVPRIAVINMGMPRTGNKAFSDYYASQNIETWYFPNLRVLFIATSFTFFLHILHHHQHRSNAALFQARGSLSRYCSTLSLPIHPNWRRLLPRPWGGVGI